MQKEYWEKLTNVWDNYRKAKEGQSVTIRSGYGLYGVYPLNGPFDHTRSESDAEHAYGTLVLARVIADAFPEVISRSELLVYLDCLAFHEYGEGVSGDIPDDGTRDDVVKDAEEFAELSLYFASWYNQDAVSDTLSAFKEMQGKNTKRGRVLYCIDKVEAILQNLIYEEQGRGADVSVKLANGGITARDAWEHEITKSSKAADMWSCDFLVRRRDFEHIDVFRDLIIAAMTDVRGERPEWIQNI